MTPCYDAPTTVFEKSRSIVMPVALQKEVAGVIKPKPGLMCQSSLMSSFSKHSKENTETRKGRRADIPSCDYVTTEREDVIKSGRQDTNWLADATPSSSTFLQFSPSEGAINIGWETK